MLQDTSRTSLNVLIVDDNVDGADTLALLLQMLGHQAIAAYNPHAGIQRAIDTSPDLIIFDFDMPGMDGCEALAELRRRAPSLRSVFVCLTGTGSRDAKERCMAAGFERFVTKPLASIELEALIDLARLRKQARYLVAVAPAAQ